MSKIQCLIFLKHRWPPFQEFFLGTSSTHSLRLSIWVQQWKPGNTKFEASIWTWAFYGGNIVQSGLCWTNPARRSWESGSSRPATGFLRQSLESSEPSWPEISFGRHQKKTTQGKQVKWSFFICCLGSGQGQSEIIWTYQLSGSFLTL